MEVDMTKGNPFPIILKFMLPLLIGNVFQQLYNMADTIIVGRFVGPEALAAVGSTGTIMFLVLGFSQGLTTGFTVLTAQCFGAKDMRRVKRSVANAILLSLLVTILTTFLSVLSMRPLLRLMNTPASIFKDAYTYIVIICYGTLASIFYNLFSAFLRSVGNSRIPLYFLVFSAVLNVGLDLLLIINLHMGVAGAGVATIISQGVSAILCLIYIIKKAPVLWPEEKRFWRINAHDTRHQMTVGIPMALQFAITASGTMIMQSAVNLFGATAVAAYTAACKLQNLLTQGMPAMGQAMSTYCGQNYGKMDYKRIQSGVKAALIIEVIYSLIAMGLAYMLLNSTLHLFFSGDVSTEEMLPWAATYTHICLMFYIPLSFIFVFRNAMQGCGYGFLPMMGGVVELIARAATAAASMALLSYPLAVLCDPAAWFSAAVFTGISFIHVMKKIKRTLPEPAESLS